MIETAEEFKKLRESGSPDEYQRAALEEASIGVWQSVITKYPDMAVWVAHNKTIPISILKQLAMHRDPDVRCMVARKRKLPENIMIILAKDSDESVRNAVLHNGKVTGCVLKILANDSWLQINKIANQKLRALTLTSK